MDVKNLFYLFDPYDQLVREADRVFQEIREKYPQHIKCEIHCSDCCYAIFGIFPIEAFFLRHDFEKLDEKKRRKALERAEKADQDLLRVQERIREFQHDPQMINYVLARERIRCPLLSENNECILYPFRPIICRVYGIPLLVRGNVRACYKAGFRKGEKYTTYNLDKTYKELFSLSKELIKAAGGDDSKASFMISVSKAISTPMERIAKGNF